MSLVIFLFFYLLINLFIFGCVGSSVRARAFSSCGKRGPLFIAVRGPLFIVVRGPLIIAASLVVEHRLQTRRLSSCGSRAQLLRGMWDLPRPGLEPVSPALAGRFSTTAPPGKPRGACFNAEACPFPWFLHGACVVLKLCSFTPSLAMLYRVRLWSQTSGDPGCVLLSRSASNVSSRAALEVISIDLRGFQRG